MLTVLKTVLSSTKTWLLLAGAAASFVAGLNVSGWFYEAKISEIHSAIDKAEKEQHESYDKRIRELVAQRDSLAIQVSDYERTVAVYSDRVQQLSQAARAKLQSSGPSKGESGDRCRAHLARATELVERYAGLAERCSRLLNGAAVDKESILTFLGEK